MARTRKKPADAPVEPPVDAASPGDGPDGIVDALPDELNAEEFVGVYQFPDNKRRRTPAVLYLAVGATMLIAWLATRNGQPVLVNRGFAFGGAFLVVVGLYGLSAGAPLGVHEADALAAASRHVGFPVGHASAQLGWQGLRSRPTWRILLYSAENPPRRRGLVLVDGIDAHVVGDLVQDNPEDWSQYNE